MIYRTTYMFSATMQPAVQRLARKYLRNPVVVTIGEGGKAPDLIKQEVIMMQDSEKMNTLQKLISDLGREKKVIVFVNTRESVVGRGIDIPDVGHVIKYDMPGDIGKHTHRIGRTGCAGKTGLSTTFLTKHDTDVFYDLKQLLIQSNSNVPPELARHEASKFKSGTQGYSFSALR